MTEAKTEETPPKATPTPAEPKAAQGQKWNRLVNDIASAWGIEPRGVVAFAASFISVKEGMKVPYEKIIEFLMICREHGMNPATKEIYAFYSFDRLLGAWKLTAGVAFDGWVKLMNAHPRYDGHESSHVFVLDRDGNATETPISCTVVIYRSDRTRPTKVTLFFKEWDQGKGQWGKQPCWQLYVKALKHCARVAFSFAGISAEEFDELADRTEIVSDVETARSVETTLALPDGSSRMPDIVDQSREFHSAPKELREQLAAVTAIEPGLHKHERVDAPPPSGSEDLYPTDFEPPRDEPSFDGNGSSEGEPPPIDLFETSDRDDKPFAKTPPKTETEIVEDEVAPDEPLVPTPEQAEQFGAWIKSRRKEESITLSKAAQALAVSAAALKQLEGGSGTLMQTLDDETLRKVFDLYGDKNVDTYKQIHKWFRRHA